jgi:outer membrane lipoprotein-sorting protein
MIKSLLLILLCITKLSFAESTQEKGERIARKVEDSQKGYLGEQSLLEMQLISANGDIVSRKIKSITQENESGDKSIIEFLYPLDVKGTKLLTWSHKDKDDDQWLFLPAFKRVKRIASSVKSGAFMGSEFTYEDFGGQSVEKYTYNFLKDENFSTHPCWVVERVPKEKSSGYSKQIVWFDQKRLLPLKVEYYDRKSELLKTGIFEDQQKIDGYWRTQKITMTNHQTKKKSIMLWQERKLKQKHHNSLFDAARLK